jgi:tetratricopeptide (TPR) repeat protein
MTNLLNDIESELKEITFVLDFAKHGGWIFALYNKVTPREDINRLLQNELKLPFFSWYYSPENPYPISYLQELTEEEKQQRALVIFSDVASGGEKTLQSLDSLCDAFAQQPHSLLFWLTEQESADVSMKAERFWALRRGIFNFCLVAKEATEKVIPKEKIAQSSIIGTGRWLNSLLTIENHQQAQDQLDFYLNVVSESEIVNVHSLTKKDANKVLPIAEAHDNVAYLFYYLGRYAEAIPFCQTALALYTKMLGEKYYPTTLAANNNLAVLYERVSRHIEAEQILERTLVVLEKRADCFAALATVLNNLASVYGAQGLLEQAKPLYARSLEIREQNLSPDHPDIASGLNELAILYYSEGDYEKVESLFQRSLVILEKSLGNDHFSVAGCLNNLARLYEKQGKFEQAEPLYYRSLAIKEQSMGQNHPSVAGSLNNLASLHQAQGKYEQAETEYKKSLAIREKVLGSDHPQVASSLNNLAILYDVQGMFEKAEALHQRAIAIAEKTLGKFHADTKRYEKNYHRFLAKKPNRMM